MQKTAPPKYAINTDWFEATLEADTFLGKDLGKIIKPPRGNIALQKRTIGTQHYQSFYHVAVNGRPFGHVLANPREGNKLDKNFIQFQALNNVQYEKSFFEEVDHLFGTMKWELRNITRVDIALDGGQPSQVIKDIWSKKVRKVGTAKSHLHMNHKFELEGFTWGSASSGKYMRCYDKTVELKMSNKGYIRDYWEKTGINCEGNIERLELVLKNEAIKSIHEFEWPKLQNVQYLASLMRTHFEKWFEFADPSTSNNVTRMARVDYVDWESIDAQLLDRAESIPPNEITRTKQACKTVYLLYLASQKVPLLNFARALATSIDHLEWFTEKRQDWEGDHEQMSGSNTDGLIHYRYFHELKDIHLDNIIMMNKEDQLWLGNYLEQSA